MRKLTKYGIPRAKPGSVLHIKSTDSPIEELRGLRGGAKNLWIRCHKEEILNYCTRFGEERCRRHFGLNRDNILPELEHRPVKDKTTDILQEDFRFKRVEYGEYEILHQDVIALRNEVLELKRLFALFEDSISGQLVQKFFKPLLSRALSINSDLESINNDVDPLDVRAILKQSSRLRIKVGGNHNEDRNFQGP